MSMGTGKMMVLFFSAEMLLKVCKYLSWKDNYLYPHHHHDNEDCDDNDKTLVLGLDQLPPLDIPP